MLKDITPFKIASIGEGLAASGLVCGLCALFCGIPSLLVIGAFAILIGVCLFFIAVCFKEQQ